MAEDKGEADKENYMSMSNALDFVSKGGELLKRTRKGIQTALEKKKEHPLMLLCFRVRCLTKLLLYF